MANVFIEEQYMSDIGDAIRNRTGKTDSIYPENMSEEILSIGADATATENDMANGVTAYVDGEIVTGKLQTIEYDGKYYGWTNGTARTMNDGTIGVGKLIDDGDVLYRNGAGVAVSAPASEFGDALPEDVAIGKTFTSASGLKATGTLEQLDTSDANATASDIALGTTAYVNGQKITGNINTVSNNAIYEETSPTNSVYKGSVSPSSSNVDYI